MIRGLVEGVERVVERKAREEESRWVGGEQSRGVG